MSNQITSGEQLASLTPEQIVEAEDRGLIDFEAIARERADEATRARRRAQQLGADLAAGRIDPDGVAQMMSNYRKGENK